MLRAITDEIMHRTLMLRCPVRSTLNLYAADVKAQLASRGRGSPGRPALADDTAPRRARVDFAPEEEPSEEAEQGDSSAIASRGT